MSNTKTSRGAWPQHLRRWTYVAVLTLLIVSTWLLLHAFTQSQGYMSFDRFTFNGAGVAAAFELKNAGVAWPGTTEMVHVEGDQLIVERHWLGMLEVRSTLRRETPTSNWESSLFFRPGPGDYVQDLLLLALATVVWVGVGYLTMRRLQPSRVKGHTK